MEDSKHEELANSSKDMIIIKKIWIEMWKNMIKDGLQSRLDKAEYNINEHESRSIKIS